MGCERANEERAQQPVNNFAANRAATVSDWPLGFNFGIGSLWLPAPAGQACQRPVAITTLSFIGRPVGRGLTL